jgi:hypothetical protein
MQNGNGVYSAKSASNTPKLTRLGFEITRQAHEKNKKDAQPAFRRACTSARALALLIVLRAKML